MKIKLKPMTEETKALWQKVAWTVQQAHDKFLSAYEASFAEVDGQWRTRWQQWENLPDIVGHVEEQIKEQCVASGMRLTTFNRYRTAARKYAFHGVPFKFGANFTVPEMAKANDLMDTYATGTPEERMEKAYQEVRAAKNLKSAQAIVKKGATILRKPKAGEEAVDYRKALLTDLASHLDAVAPVLTGNDKTAKLLRQVSALINSTQKKTAVA